MIVAQQKCVWLTCMDSHVVCLTFDVAIALLFPLFCHLGPAKVFVGLMFGALHVLLSLRSCLFAHLFALVPVFVCLFALVSREDSSVLALAAVMDVGLACLQVWRYALTFC